MNVCEADGYLVGRSYGLPADPTDYQWVDRRPTIGCNRLRCQRCGAWVRSQLGWQEVPGANEHMPEVYDAGDWSTVAWVKPGDAGERLYACRCGYVRVGAIREVRESVERDVEFPWRCGGHPIVTLPFSLNGVDIDATTDLAALVRAPWAAPDDATVPQIGSRELRARLAGTPLVERLDEGMARLLDDPLPAVRMVALGYYFAHPDASGRERVLELAQGDRAGFAGVPDPQAVFGPTLEARLVGTLTHLAEAGTVGREALLVLRHDAVRPELSALLLPTLLRIDRAWALDQLVAAVAATPARAPELVLLAHGALGFEYAVLKELVQRVLAQPGVSPDAIRAEADARLGWQAVSVTALLPTSR